MLKRQWFLQDEAQGGDQGGGGGTIEPAKAREFVTQWAPNPDILKDMPDDQVMAWHGNINKQLAAAQQKAVESYDWRKGIAGDNPEAMKTLERFQSPKALYDSYDQFRTKMSKGELRAVAEFPAKGTDEEKATWRQQNGVPVDGKYELKPPEGVVIGDEDKATIESFQKYAHEQNMPAGEFNKSVNWWFQKRMENERQAAQAFKTRELETAAELGTEWGPDYKPNMNKIQSVLDSTIPEGDEGKQLKDLIGKALRTNPMFARHYASIALELNPTGTMVPGDRGASEGSVTDELKKLDGLMRTDRKAYDAQQNRYRDLLGAYQKMTGKQWGQP